MKLLDQIPYFKTSIFISLINSLRRAFLVKLAVVTPEGFSNAVCV